MRMSPDTCGCSFEYASNGDMGQTLISYVKKCPLHIGMNDIDAHKDALEINQTKNLAISLLRTQHPELFPNVVVVKVNKIPSTVIPPQGFRIQDTVDGKSEILLDVQYDVNWEIKSDRTVSIKAPKEMTNSDKINMNSIPKEIITSSGLFTLKKQVSYE